MLPLLFIKLFALCLCYISQIRIRLPCSCQSHLYLFPISIVMFQSHISSDCSIINVFTWKTVRREDTMIHINVPDTQTLVEDDGVTKYTVINIFIWGFPIFLKFFCQIEKIRLDYRHLTYISMVGFTQQSGLVTCIKSLI